MNGTAFWKKERKNGPKIVILTIHREISAILVVKIFTPDGKIKNRR